jgi:ATP-dependent Clp protease ATP-binding subunit ClpB
MRNDKRVRPAVRVVARGDFHGFPKTFSIAGPERSELSITANSVDGVLADRGYQLEVSEAAREYLAEVGYDPDFGARPLKRAIQRELQDSLALKILSGDFQEGDIIRADRGEDGLIFSTSVQGEAVEA